MPTSSSHKDIYRVRPPHRPALPGRASSPRDEMEWFRRSAAMNRWTNALFLLMIVVLLAFLVGIIVHQQSRIQAVREEVSPPVRFSLRPASPDSWLEELDPDIQLELDEWLVRGPEPVGEGPHPMNARWIQEAALHLRRAESAYRAGNWRTALEHYESAARIFPAIEGIDVQRGVCHLRLREFAEAESFFSAAAERGVDSAGLHNNRAVALMGLDRPDEAAPHLQRAIQQDPEYLPARHNLALLQYQAGNLAAAADMFAELDRRRPLSAEHLHLYALTLLRLEQWKKAAAVLRESIQRYPQVPPIRFRLAEALAHASEPEAAMAALREAAALVDARHAMRWISRSEFDPLRPRPEFKQLVAELSGGLP